MLRHIAWFNEASIAPNPQGGLSSDDPCVVRRCLAPAASLENRGVSCSVFGNLHDADPAEVAKLLQKLGTNVVVIGRFTEPSMIKLARTAKHLGCYIVADFADQTSVSEDFEKLAALADRLVAATPEALEVLEKHHFKADVIADAEDNPASPACAEIWMSCFKNLQLKPPACANSNTPPEPGPDDHA